MNVVLKAPSLSIAVALICLGRAASGAESEPQTKPLPRVLILGDSISLGYTPLVKQRLAGKAEVLRPRENCQHTGTGLLRIKTWLGDGKWDVIHFNWGIWDTHLLDAEGKMVRDESSPEAVRQRYTPEEYRRNLTQLVDALQATGATLIWAETTPVMRRSGDRFEAVPRLNAVAAALMHERRIAVNDLYAFVLPHAAQWQTADRVHFTAAGSEKLAERVAEKIEAALAVRAGEGK